MVKLDEESQVLFLFKDIDDFAKRQKSKTNN